MQRIIEVEEENERNSLSHLTKVPLFDTLRIETTIISAKRRKRKEQEYV